MPRQSLFTHSILIIIIFILAGPALADAPVVKSVAVAGTIYPVALATQLGHPYDALVIEKDVRKLWSTGRFDDIWVESKLEADGAALVFLPDSVRNALAQEWRLTDAKLESFRRCVLKKVRARLILMY